MPNVLSPRELDSRPDNMDETLLSSSSIRNSYVHLFYRFANDYAEFLYTISVPTPALLNCSHCPAFHDATFHSTLSYLLF